MLFQHSTVSARPKRTPAVAVAVSRHNIGLVGFHDVAFPIALLTAPASPWLRQRIDGLKDRIGGRSTNGTDGLRKALAMLAKRNVPSEKGVFLLTDGIFNAETDRLSEIVQEAIGMHVPVTTVGFGNDVKAELLAKIASVTGGQSLTVNSLEELTNSLLAAAQSTVRAAERRRGRSDFVCAIDCSPSMCDAHGSQTKIDTVKTALKQLLAWHDLTHR